MFSKMLRSCASFVDVVFAASVFFGITTLPLLVIKTEISLQPIVSVNKSMDTRRAQNWESKSSDATNMAMHAMILAAGLGTRLRPITDRIPKPLVPVVGIPNIIRTIRGLTDAGVNTIVINTHWQPDVLKRRLGNGSEFDVRIVYSDEPTLLGTGGGIKKALPFLGKEAFIVVNGDALFAPDFKSIIRFHKENNAAATLVLRADPAAETYGAIGIDGTHRIRRMVWVGRDIPELKPLMFCGVHVIEPEIARQLPNEGCIVRKTYAPLIEAGEPIFGMEENSYFCDLGTPGRFLTANIDLVTGRERIRGVAPAADGVFLGKGVHIGKGCVLKSGTVISDGARIADNVTIENTTVMENVCVTQDLKGAVASPDGIVSV